MELRQRKIATGKIKAFFKHLLSLQSHRIIPIIPTKAALPADKGNTVIPFAPLVTLLYGVLAIAGGAIGYKQAGSQVSLISGFISGLLLLIGAYLMFGGVRLGPILSASVSLLLIIVFIARLIKTKKFMPAGLMVAVGIINLIALWATLPAV